MGRGRRAGIAALIGMACAVAWAVMIQPVGDFLYRGTSGIGAAFFPLLFVAPVLGLVWTLIGWWLLGLTGFRPAWPTAFAGLLASTAFAVVGVLVVIGMRLSPTDESALAGLALAAAAGYALAAVVTAGYGGRRDRTEHSGQDG